MANLFGTGNHQEQHAHVNPSTFYGNSVPESSSGLVVNMNHDPGIYWTPKEQATLEVLLTKYASLSKRLRYAAIAQALNDKTVKDVARRVTWMNKKEDSRRRKDGHNLSQKSKNKKERVSDPAAKSSQFSARPNVPPYAPQMIPPIDNNEAIPYAAIEGPSAVLLEQNAQALSQISANLFSRKHGNLDRLCQTRDNILRIIKNDMEITSEALKKMPPLPVKLNEKLANSILPLPRHQPQ